MAPLSSRFNAIENAFSLFIGGWQFHKKVISAATTILQQEAWGIASIIRVNSTDLAYYEEGKDHSGNEFYRHYTYRLTRKTIEVHYADGPQSGELYQAYTLKDDKLVCDTKHQCKADCYNSSYHWISENSFQLVTQVTGPRKNFVIETVFQRA